jgi:hypothetical protein
MNTEPFLLMTINGKPVYAWYEWYEEVKKYVPFIGAGLK